MKVLLTGASGMVGSKFVELYKDQFEIITPIFPDFNLTDLENVRQHLADINPEVIIHFAAYTNVSQAENERNNKEGEVWKINVTGTENLIKVINSQKCHFIHISTDYVFPGSKENPGPYAEDHQPEDDSNKLTWYGYTKREAERVVEKYLGKEKTILRLIYPVRTHFPEKLDYLRKPLHLYDEGKLYPLFQDQQVTISFVDEICLALTKIMESKAFGIFHASTPDTSTPYELVSYLLKKARGVENVVTPASLEDTGRYPKYGGLKVEMTERQLGIKYSSWQKVIDTLVAQGLE